MKNQEQTDSCETQTETCDSEETTACSSEKSNKFTTVKTVYARAAVFLLALNFCLTGYVVYNMNKTTQAQIDSITGSTSEVTERQTATANEATTQTLESTEVKTPTGETTTPTPVTTRD